MTNLEKLKEIFGDTGADVKAVPSWLAKEYNGPVKKTEQDKFIDWLKTLPLIKYQIDGDGVYVKDFNGKPIIRVSDFCSVTDSAYVRYEGLTGQMPVSKIKSIIVEAEKKSDPLKSLFGADSLYNDIFKSNR